MVDDNLRTSHFSNRSISAEAIAAMGGTAGQLSNGLWQARGDEFSVEKADFGYMAWDGVPAGGG